MATTSGDLMPRGGAAKRSRSEQVVDYERLGDVIRGIRSEAGMERKDLADALGQLGLPATKDIVANWESGRSRPMLHHVFAIIAICEPFGRLDRLQRAVRPDVWAKLAR